ncbi:MAG TPA: hypothetical protein QGG18_03710 [Rhodospirillales bacterium]|jgi:hypothetical protein|nr:hypothetical protein [Planctomycetota bacterium]HJN24789.1 hypothetical protein [Rhodospirillales bacterium]|tara:strand:+ start:1250 stop:1453 length:204 start_codon:yes stop_codon:yes gene_type:complete
MINALSPDRMTATERLDEVADILAAGILRQRNQETANKYNDLRDISLDFTAGQSVHGHDINDHGEST